MQTQYFCEFWGTQTPVPVLGLKGLLPQPSWKRIHGLVGRSEPVAMVEGQ